MSAESVSKPSFIDIQNGQQILFEGYIRMQILSNASHETLRIMTYDVVDICNAFFMVDITSAFNQCKDNLLQDEIEEMYTFKRLCDQFMDNEEYFLGHNVLNILCQHTEYEEYHGFYHSLNGELLFKWNDIGSNKATIMKERAMNEFETAIKLRPNDDLLQYNYAHCLAQSENYVLAINQFSKVYEMDPGDHYSLTRIAMCYAQLKENEKATTYYLKTIAVSPCTPNLLQFAEFLKNINDYKTAKIYYQKALDLEDLDENPEMHFDYACMLGAGMEEYQAALNIFLQLSELDPNNSEYILESAYCYEKLHDIDNTHKFYRKAIDQTEGEEKEIPYNWYGQWLVDEMKDLEQAKDCFLKAIQVKPNAASSYYHIAGMYRDDYKDYNESEKWYLKCLVIDDEYDGLHASYGYLLYLMGQYEKAMEYVNHELELHPNTENGWAYIYASLLYKTFDNDETAEIMAWKAITLLEQKECAGILQHIKRMIIHDTLNGDYLITLSNMISSKFEYINGTECMII